MRPNTSASILLLDLGGVLADLGSPTAAIGLEMSDDEFWSIWLASDAVAAFETGRSDYDEFRKKLASEFPSHARGAIESRLPAWRLNLYPEVEDLVDVASRRFDLALLSNTNSLHWGQLDDSARVFSKFAKLFLSFETGLYKPDEASFLQVSEHFNCDPSDISFFDDSEANVSAAASLGINAKKVAGPQALEDALVNLSTA